MIWRLWLISYLINILKKIYIQKVFPIGRKYSKTVINRIINYNNEIEKYCKTISNVKFIDATTGFVDS